MLPLHKLYIRRRPLASLGIDQPLSKSFGIVFGKLQWAERVILVMIYSNDQSHVSAHQLFSALLGILSFSITLKLLYDI